MKTKYELEYTFNTSASMLFNRISTPEGLSEWFADDVNLENGLYTFIWEGSESIASVVQKKSNKFIRFHWEDEEEEEEEEEDLFFEFRIHTVELTGDVALIITDFAEEEEKGDAIDLWNSQISELKQALGI